MLGAQISCADVIMPTTATVSTHALTSESLQPRLSHMLDCVADCMKAVKLHADNQGT